MVNAIMITDTEEYFQAVVEIIQGDYGRAIGELQTLIKLESGGIHDE